MALEAYQAQPNAPVTIDGYDGRVTTLASCIAVQGEDGKVSLYDADYVLSEGTVTVPPDENESTDTGNSTPQNLFNAPIQTQDPPQNPQPTSAATDPTVADTTPPSSDPSTTDTVPSTETGDNANENAPSNTEGRNTNTEGNS